CNDNIGHHHGRGEQGLRWKQLALSAREIIGWRIVETMQPKDRRLIGSLSAPQDGEHRPFIAVSYDGVYFCAGFDLCDRLNRRATKLTTLNSARSLPEFGSHFQKHWLKQRRQIFAGKRVQPIR